MNGILTAILFSLSMWGCSNSQASPHQHQVLLKWTAPVTPPAFVGYNVYRAKSGTVTFSKLTTAPIASAAFIDSTVQKKTTYLYYVTAVNSTGGESKRSNLYQAVIPNP